MRFLITFLAFLTFSQLFSQSFGYLTLPSGEKISDNTLLFKHSDLTVSQLAALNEIGATYDWVSPLSGTTRIRINTSVYPITILFEGQLLDLSNIIDVNDGIVQKPGAGVTERDNYDFLLQVELNSNGGETDCTQNLSPATGALNGRVKVGIFDTGFNSNIGNGVVPPAAGGYDYVNNSSQISIDHYHGTHIASIIHKLIVDNGKVGMVDYYNYKILGEDGHGIISDVIIAAENAVANDHVQILNFSLSGEVTSGMTVYLKDLQRGLMLNNALLIVSAGNASTNIDNNGTHNAILPANLQSPITITVGSIDCQNEKSIFSNFGNTSVDFFTYGEHVGGYNQNEQLIYLSGTSQATALATGIATLLATHQVDFNAEKIKCAMMNGLDKSIRLKNLCVGGGKLNGANALLKLLNNESCGVGNRSNEELKVKFNVYPNPTTSDINLHLNSGRYNVCIYNVTGSKVYDQIHVSKGEPISINNTDSFKKGMYIITCQNTNSQEMHSSKLIID